MENFSYHVPVYVVTGGVDLEGHVADLPAGGVGIYDRATFSVATSSGNGKELFFAQGGIGGKDWYAQPVKESHKSPYFMASEVENIYLSLPKRIQNEEWIIGYNGSASSKGLSFEKGKATRLKFFFHGNPTFRFFAAPKEYVVSYTPEEDCTTPCNEPDCPDGISDCLTHTKALIDKINTHTELYKFGVKASLVVYPYSSTVANMEKYKLEVCDNGDVLALNEVKAQYPSLTITRTKREGSTSTYEFCQPEPDSAPAAFQQSADVSLAVCSECPTGSTLTSAKDVYYVTRVISDSTDVSTLAATVANAYETVATIATADVSTGDDEITETAHKFVTGQKVTYANGGGTDMTGLTNNTDYFVIKTGANTFKLATTYANAVAGTAINITGTGNNAQTLRAVYTGTFTSQSAGTALIKVVVDSGADMTTIGSDVVNFSHTIGETCVFSTPAAISWVANGTGIRSSRDLKLKSIKRTDCTAADRLAEIETALAGVKGIQLDTLDVIEGEGCADDYTVSQWSQDCLTEEECLTNNVTFTYDMLPAFENTAWEVVPPSVSPDDTRKCGIRVTAGYHDPKFSNCTFMVNDYYETMPVKMEISLLDETASACDVANWPTVMQSRVGQISRQSGEWVVREVIMKTQAYLKHQDQFSHDARMREAFDQNLLSMVDRNAFYKLYYVTFPASYGNNFFRKGVVKEKFTAVFAFKEDDAAAATFESKVLDVLTAKSGVLMHIND